MTDNLLDMAYLNSLIIVDELIDKTQRCAVVWDQLPNSSYHTSFFWKNQLYDFYLTPMQNTVVGDALINGRNVLSATSYIYPTILDLYNAVSEVINVDPAVQILQDLNLTQECQSKYPIVGSGGLKTGGTAIFRQKNRYAERGSGGVKTGGYAETLGGSGIGFDSFAWGITSFFNPSINIVPNIATDISLLNNCSLVFCGLMLATPDPITHQYENVIIKFTSDQYPKIKAWIQSGGRLWLQTEYQAYVESLPNSQVTAIRDFLTGIGATMTYLGGAYDDSPSPGAYAYAGAANIAQGLTFEMDDTAAIGGGTPVWHAPSSNVAMTSVEQIGSGFLFLCGDSNVLYPPGQGGPTNSSVFVNRMYSYPNDQVIGTSHMMLSEPVVLKAASPSVNSGMYIALNNKIQLLNNGKVFSFYTGSKYISDLCCDGDLFWSQFSDGNASIYSCDSKNNVKQLVDSDTNSEIRCIALDPDNRKIYFVINELKNGLINWYRLWSCSYDGSNLQIVYKSKNNYTPHSIAVGGGYVFWCDGEGIADGYVMRSNLNGDGVVELLLTSGHIRSICVQDNVLYLGGAGLLSKSDLNGNNIVYLPTSGLSIINDIKISNGSMYLCDLGIGAIIQTDLNGNDPKRLTDDYITMTAMCIVN